MKNINDRVAVIIQARTGSSRLPGKVLADLAGRPLIEFLVERLKKCSLADQYILATTKLPEDNLLAELGSTLGLTVVRGDAEDVLSRYALAAEQIDASILVRITGDCPFIDPSLLDEMIGEFTNQKIDYYSNCEEPTYPDGLDIEIFTREALIRAQAECTEGTQREHVTPWIRESGKCLLGQKQMTQIFRHIAGP